MQCRFTGSCFKPHWRHSFAGDDVPQIFVFLGAIAIFGRKKKIFPNFLPDTLGGGVSQPDPPPPPPSRPPPPPPPPLLIHPWGGVTPPPFPMHRCPPPRGCPDAHALAGGGSVVARVRWRLAKCCGGWWGGGGAARHVVDDLNAEGEWAATTVKRPPQQPAQPPVPQLLGLADAATTPQKEQRPSEHSAPTQRTKGRPGDCPGPCAETARSACPLPCHQSSGGGLACGLAPTQGPAALEGYCPQA